MHMVSLSTRNWATRLGTVGLLILLAVGSVVLLMPQTDYLPQGNRNFVLSILVPPPGLSQQERQDIGEKLFVMAEPHMKKEA